MSEGVCEGQAENLDMKRGWSQTKQVVKNKIFSCQVEDATQPSSIDG